MAGNPLVPLGTLNRLLTQVTWNSFPSLNVTPSYLGRESVHLARDGEAVVYIPTLTGAVTSPEPYLMITMTMHLLKTQGLAGQYEAQMVSSALLGDGTVYSDSSVLPTFPITNCSIKSIRELDFSGADAGYVVMIGGYYYTNNLLWG